MPYSSQMLLIIDSINSVKELNESKEKEIILVKLEECYMRLKELEQK